MTSFDIIEFGFEDIVRSGLVRDFIMTKELVDRGKLWSGKNMKIQETIIKRLMN